MDITRPRKALLPVSRPSGTLAPARITGDLISARNSDKCLNTSAFACQHTLVSHRASMQAIRIHRDSLPASSPQLGRPRTCELPLSGPAHNSLQLFLPVFLLICLVVWLKIWLLRTTHHLRIPVWTSWICWMDARYQGRQWSSSWRLWSVCCLR
jgi:hypothetical protein